MDEPHGRPLISIEEALAAILEATPVLPAEQVALAHSAGRVLAADVPSDVDVPPFDRCAMDGWAFRSDEAAAGSARLRIVGEVAAGRLFPREVAAGETVRVMTGAPLPRGCDAVEPLERTSDDGEWLVLSSRAVRGQHVQRHGEDLRIGDVVLAAGTLIGAAQVGALATVGRSEVAVHGRPLAAVVSTGDELVEVGERPGPGQIRNSNGPMLAVLGRMLGCDPVQLLPVARDEREALSRSLSRGLAADILLVSGGVSKGQKDLVQVVLPELGVENIFHGVSIQPGKPLWFGRAERCLVFALPGNPVSALTTARIFVGAAVRKMRGLRDPRPRTLPARLSEPFRRKGGRPGWLPAWVTPGEDGWLCRPLASSGSADVVSSAAANATWVAPQGITEFAAGDPVQVLLHLDWMER